MQMAIKSLNRSVPTAEIRFIETIFLITEKQDGSASDSTCKTVMQGRKNLLSKL